ncbi:MAG: hypothetical protein ACJ76Y_25940 [Thermoanaerobaculia bacterium]
MKPVERCEDRYLAVGRLEPKEHEVQKHQDLDAGAEAELVDSGSHDIRRCRVRLKRGTELPRRRLGYEFTPSRDDFGPLLLGSVVVDEAKVGEGGHQEYRCQTSGKHRITLLKARRQDSISQSRVCVNALETVR